MTTPPPTFGQHQGGQSGHAPASCGCGRYFVKIKKTGARSCRTAAAK